MKKSLLFSIITILFIGLLSSLYYYNHIQKDIPSHISKSNQTIFNIDKIRFTFKVGSLTKAAMNKLLYGLRFKNEECIEDSIEHCEAAIAFANIDYTKDDKIIKYVIPKLEKNIKIIEENRFNLNDKQIKKIRNSFSDINYFIENREKNIWATTHQNFINFRTDELEKLNLYLITIVVTLILSFVIIAFLVYRNFMTKQNESLLQKLNYASDKALAGYWEWHLDTNYLYLSKGWKRFLGYEDNELENNFKTIEKIMHPDDFEITMNIVNNYIEKEDDTYKTKFRLKHKDGTYKWVSAIGTRAENNKNIFFGFHIDIDDLTTTKETLIEQSKSAMMGEMIGAIAHQLKQPLSIISVISSNQIASLEFDMKITNDMIIKDANENLKQVLHLSETIDTFRNFLKPDNEKTCTSIESIIKKSLNIVHKSLTNNDIQLVENYSKTDEIKVYSSELMQVFINLINNSKDAFKINNIDNRVITITTKQQENNIVVNIEDTAGGIPTDKIDNIFNAYFTTKENDGGTGLGLYIVKTIIEEHYNGAVEVRNIDNGALFTLTLPLSENKRALEKKII